VRAACPDARILLLTGVGIDLLDEKARRLGADAVLDKGGQFSEVPDVLATLCAEADRVVIDLRQVDGGLPQSVETAPRDRSTR